jgi:1,5-anhydro-D-fructose reductase (1,5-anhydro-D-mannitol-forming)
MAVMGLGVVGRRMIEQVALHRGWRIASAYDADPAVRAALQKDHPGCNVVDNAAAAMAHPGVDLVYVAVPPLFHHELVLQAIAAGRAVLCEKPLGIDVSQSQRLAQAMNQSGLPQAVNFVFSSSDAVDRLAQGLQAPDFDLRSIEIRLHFKEWPRDWQRGAAWLTQANQGGFVREVLSHFIYLLIRLRGPVRLCGTQVLSPVAGAAEISAQALLDAAGVPVSVSGVVGGSGPDVVEARFIGASQAYVLSDWYHLIHHDAHHPQGQKVQGLPESPRVATYQRQLNQLLSLLKAQPHSLASFDTALAVQVLIEAVLAQRQISDF